jgi:hypothetical protein
MSAELQGCSERMCFFVWRQCPFACRHLRSLATNGMRVMFGLKP